MAPTLQNSTELQNPRRKYIQPGLAKPDPLGYCVALLTDAPPYTEGMWRMSLYYNVGA